MDWKKAEAVVERIMQAVVIAVIFFSLFLFMQVRNTSTTAKNVAEQAVHSAEVSQEKSGVRTCLALEQLAHVGDGIKFSPPTKTGTAEAYVIRLNRALIAVVDATGCNKLK